MLEITLSGTNDELPEHLQDRVWDITPPEEPQEWTALDMSQARERSQALFRSGQGLFLENGDSSDAKRHLEQAWDIDLLVQAYESAAPWGVQGTEAVVDVIDGTLESLGVPEGARRRHWQHLSLAHASVANRATAAQNTVLAGLLTIMGEQK